MKYHNKYFAQSIKQNKTKNTLIIADFLPEIFFFYKFRIPVVKSLTILSCSYHVTDAIEEAV